MTGAGSPESCPGHRSFTTVHCLLSLLNRVNRPLANLRNRINPLAPYSGSAASTGQGTWGVSQPLPQPGEFGITPDEGPFGPMVDVKANPRPRPRFTTLAACRSMLRSPACLA